MRLFDLHCDTLTAAYDSGQSLWRNSLHLDGERGCAFVAWRQIFAVFTPDALRGDAAWERARQVLAFAKEQVDRYPDRFRLIRSLADWRAVAPHQCGMILALESAAPLAGDLSRLDGMAGAGVKVITFTWNGENECGFGCGCDPRAGLKPFGKALARRMAEKGIVPDVSHLNPAGFWDVMDAVSGPVIASHSVSAAVHPHPRNLTDEQFDALRDRGGLVGLNFCADQLGGLSLEQIERHLDRFLSRGGERTVALGGDLDGVDLPEKWQGIGIAERLREYLCRKNYEEWLLDRLFFGNGYDFFDKAFSTFDK
ncbi:MAG: dipeptidase [Acutalibacteraceae bacterium]